MQFGARHRHVLFWCIFIWSSLVLGNEAVKASSAEEIEPLTFEQLRQCRIESMLLIGEASVLDPQNFWEVHDYNKHREPYRSRCQNRSFSSNHMKLTKREFTADIRKNVELAGKRRYAFRQIGRDHNRLHVVSKHTRVYSSSEPDAQVIGDLIQWEELFELSSLAKNRRYVEWIEADTLLRKTGWLDNQAVKRGDGGLARENFCKAHQGSPLEAHEILQGSVTKQWSRVLRVNNRAPQDAFVKLVNQAGRVELAFVVKSGFLRSVSGIPDGVYDLHFITGSDFSRGCGSFAKRGLAGVINQKIYYDQYGFEWEVALNEPIATNSVLDIREYTTFDAL